MTALFPLPAVLFLISLVIVLVILALVYFFFLKDGKCCQNLEGADVAEEEVGLLPPEDGAATPAAEGEKKNKEDVESGGGGEGGGGGVVENGSAGGNGGSAGGEGDGAISGGQNTTVDTTTGGEDLTDAPPAPEDPVAGTSLSGTPLTTRPPPPQSEAHESKGAPSVSGGSKAGTASASASGNEGLEEVEVNEPLCLAGKVLISFTYMPAANKINLNVIRTQDLPSVSRGGSENIQIHLCILPQRKQRFRTAKQPSAQGVFNQTFQFVHMTKDLLETCAIRLRVYGVQRFSKSIIGEVKLPLSKIDLTSSLSDGDIWKNLSPKGLVAEILQIDDEDEPDDIDDWALE